MLKCEIGKDIKCSLMAAGSTTDIIDDILNIIKWNYNAMLRRDPASAESFRLLMQTILLDPNCKVFDGNGEAIVIDLSRRNDHA